MTDHKLVVSECRYDVVSQACRVRGWTSPSSEALTIGVSIPGLGMIARNALNTFRADAPKGESRFNGFDFTLPIGPQPEKLKIHAFQDDVEIAAKWKETSPGDDVAFFEAQYHDDLKLLRLSGALRKDQLVAEISLRLSTGQLVPMQYSGRNLDEMASAARTTDQHLLKFSGFGGEFHLSLGEVRQSAVRILFADGSVSESSLPNFVVANVGSEILQVSARLELCENWAKFNTVFLSYSQVTSVEVRLDGQRLNGVRSKVEHCSAYKEKFRSRSGSLYQLTLIGQLPDLGIDAAALSAEPTLQITVKNEQGELIEYERQLSDAEVVTYRGLMANYRELGSLVSVVGRAAVLAPENVPQELEILRNGIPIGRTAKIDVHPLWRKHSSLWRADVRVNGNLKNDNELTVRLNDRTVFDIGAPLFLSDEKRQQNNQAMVISERIESIRRAVSGTAKPLAVVFVPNDLRGLFGGAARRIEETVRFLKGHGFTTVVIDRSRLDFGPGEHDGACQAGKMADIFMPLPEAALGKVGEAVLKKFAARMDKALHRASEGAFSKSARVVDETSIIRSREDKAFNFLVMCIADILAADVSIANYAWSTSSFGIRRRGCEIVDLHDIQTLRAIDFARMKDEHPDLFASDGIVFRETIQNELRYIERADFAVVLSDEEFAFLRDHMTVGRLSCAPISANLAESEAFERGPEPRALFVGGRYAPNIDAARRLIAMAPAIAAQVPGFKLSVVGSVCEVLDSCDEPSVELLGIVDDLADVYRGAAISLNPTLFGTGQPVKTIESVAHGVPVLATPNGARGCGDLIEAGAVEISEIEDFADALIKKLQQAEPLHRDAVAGLRRFNVDENFSMLGKQINHFLFQF